jgi:hypothetical protein
MNGAALAACAWLFIASACSRTGLWQLVPATEESGGRGGSGGAPAGSCVTASDCPWSDPCAPPACVPLSNGRGSECVAEPLDCDDGNACTFDRCAPDLGACEHQAPEDLDRDGYVGLAPPGAPASCGGVDCNDDNPAIHPNAAESCNGRDDDCDGAIDEGTAYRVASRPRELAPGEPRSQHGGIAWNDAAYGVTYTTSDSSHKRSYFGLLDANGEHLREPSLVSEINADTYSGSVAWSGQSFLTVWHDARQAANYEIYETRFDANAEKLAADQRITNAPDFSLRPIVRYSGSEYLLAWDDQRFEDTGGALGIYGHRISAGGALLGSEVLLTSSNENAEFGTFAIGEERVGFAYIVGDFDDYAALRFRSFDRSWQNGVGPVELTNDSLDPSIARVGDRFVVAWASGSQARGWGSAIQAALVDANGNVLVARAVTSGDIFARWRTLVSLGDRVLLIWSGLPPGGATFELYFQTLSAADLSPLSERQLLATSPAGGELVDPLAILGPEGDIAVVYDDNRSGVITSYFIHLACQ